MKFAHAAAVSLICLMPLGAQPTVAAEHARVAQAKPEKERDAASDQVLKDAIAQLQAIRTRVHGAAKIDGGHRGKADEHLDAAIRELQAALSYDEHKERK